MTTKSVEHGLSWLRQATDAGEIRTVRVSWSDRLGALRGKRLPALDFLRNPERRIGFCDGMIVVDVQCAVHQATPFSNFDTGYPDMYLSPELDTLRRVAWADREALVLGELQGHHGEAIHVSPRVVHRDVVKRAAEAGITARVRPVLSGRMMRSPSDPVDIRPGMHADELSPRSVPWFAMRALDESGIEVSALETGDDGFFRMTLAEDESVAAGDSLVLAAAAMRETAISQGVVAVFMTKTPVNGTPSTISAELRLTGLPEEDLAGGLPAALADVRPLLQPSVNAYKLGPVATPTVQGEDGGVLVRGLSASSEADPHTVLACFLSAACAERQGAATSPPDVSVSLSEGAARLRGADWLCDWLGTPFLENAIPLIDAEASEFAGAVTDWEVARYWAQG